MRRILVIFLLCIVATSCTRTIYVPTERTTTITHYEVDTVVEIVTPPERVVSITVDTISVVSTTLATSTARIKDGTLYHDITQHERKDSVPITTIHTHVVDSVSYPVPYPVIEKVTPQWAWWALAVSFLTVSFIITTFLIKIRK